MAKNLKFKPVVQPTYGLFYDRPEINIPDRGLVEGLNFRLSQGSISAANLGWSRFLPGFQLNGPIMAIASFLPHDRQEFLMLMTPSDLYAYDDTNNKLLFLTPTYTTGTAAASGTAVTGAGTSWTTNASVGDEISFGSASVNDSTAVWYKITAVGSNTGLTLATSAGTKANLPYTLRRKFKSNRRDFWDWTVFVQDADSGDDLFMVTNGVDPVLSWNGYDLKAVSHPEFGFRCTCLTSWSNMVIYANLFQISTSTSYPTSIINSDVGRPLKAGDVGTGLSEQFRVQDDPEEIVLLLPLADNLVIYAKRTITVAQFVGDPTVFAFRNAANGYGPVGRYSVADFGDHHEFVHLDGQYGFDGTGLREINSHVWRGIIKNSDPGRREFTFSHFDEQQAELIWSVPSASDPGSDADRQGNFAWSEHYLEDFVQGVEGTPYSMRQFPFTAAGLYQQKSAIRWEDLAQSWSSANYSWSDQFFQAAYPLNITGDDDGKLYVINSTQKGDGVALPSRARFGRVAMGSGRERGLLRRVYPYVLSQPATMYVKSWLTDSAGGALTDGGSLNMNLQQPQGGHFVSPFRRARFVSLEFGSTGDPWQLQGYDLDMNAGGMR
jgi:hypothetical protein